MFFLFSCLFFEPQLTIPLPRNYVFSLQVLFFRFFLDYLLKSWKQCSNKFFEEENHSLNLHYVFLPNTSLVWVAYLLQNLCRGAIASMVTYDGVDRLNLPQMLKNYIKVYYYKHPVKTTNHAPPFEVPHGRTSNLTHKTSSRLKKINRHVLDS